MNNLLFLVVAILLLWLAVTGRIGKLLDAWGVLTGSETATQTASTGSGANVSIEQGLPTLDFPSLPVNGTNINVGL